MTIASEITRLQNAKSSIATSIGNKGVTVPAATTLSGYSSLIDQIVTVNDTPLEITGATTYGGIYSVGNYQSISGIDGCVSYDTGEIVLIGYMGNWQTYDNYDQKDCHFIRWKRGQARKDYTNDIGTGTSYTFRNGGLYLTKESDGSYLFTANAYYITDGSSNRPYVCQIRYTVSTDTFTLVQSGSGSATPTQDNMNLYTASWELGNKSRTALFNLRNT